MILPPAVAEPVTSPVRVSVTVELAAMIAFVVITIDADVIRDADPDNPIMMRERSPKKKKVGRKMEILSPLGIAPPTDVMKLMVA